MLAWALAAASAAHAPGPVGKQPLDWRPDPLIAKVFSQNIDFQGGGPFVVWRNPGGVREVEGRQCLVGPYFLFDVDDARAFDIDEDVTLELSFDRESTDGFNLSWDHAVNPTSRQVRLDEAGEGRWASVTVRLERARFANRKVGGADFSIGALGAMHPPDPRHRGELTLCGVRLQRPGSAAPRPPAGTLQLEIQGPDGKPESARVGLYAADGRAPLPGTQALQIDAFSEPFRTWPMLDAVAAWSNPGRFVFYVDGRYTAEVPAGDYELFVWKGPEYRLETRRLSVRPGVVRREDLRLRRWRDLPAEGWYSGDAHIHVGRPGPEANPGVLAFTRAEDVHVANLLQMGTVASADNFVQYAFGPAGRYVVGTHALVPGQESPRSSHRGHTIGLNARSLAWSREDYFLYDRVAERIRGEGGLYGYAHVALDTFNLRHGLAIDVPLGVVDFLEVLQMGLLDTRYLYDFLNLGYRVLPAAGSDYPYIDIAGTERIYARLRSAFSTQAWFDAWQGGRSFVSNGPILDFTVNGKRWGNELVLAPGAALRIEASAAMNPDLGPLERLELVMQGEVVASTVAADGAGELALARTLTVDRSGWMALRVRGKEKRHAHSAPVYLRVGDDTRTWRPESVAAIAGRYLALLAEFRESTPRLDEDWERFATEDLLLPVWQQDRESLMQRLDRAEAVYRRLIEEAAAPP